MYTLLVTVDVHPEKIDEFVVAITANAKAALSNEPGCLAFDVHRDIGTPARFYFYEVYTDEEAFMIAHRGSAHFSAWQAAAEHVLVPDSRRVIFAEAVHVGSSAGDR